MTTQPTIDLRPRTAGEVLDDAWRLALAEAPLLLALSGLFAVPAAIALLLLLTRPTPLSTLDRCLLPALAALLLPLTGLGSAACQELLRRRAWGERVTLGACLKAALRRAPQHAAGRALTLLGVGLGLAVLALPGLALWVSLGTLHAILATGDGRLFAALADSARDAQRQPARSSAVVLSRLPLLVFAVVNLYLLAKVGLWVAGSLAGLDVAFLDLLLSITNAAYVIALVALAWLLLTPYFEASNFLLHLDNRVRHDGLDLAYRVRTLFRATDRGKVAAVVLALGGLLLCAGPTRADEQGLADVRKARHGLRQLIDEVKTANPYPRDGRYEKRLRALYDGMDLDPERVPWFAKALDGFGQRGRESALQVLNDLDEKLAHLEESLEPPEGAEAVPRLSRDQIKKLQPGSEDGRDAARSKPREKPREEQEKVRRDDPAEDGPGRHPGGGGGGVLAPQPGGAGLGPLGWTVLGGLALAVLAVAVVLYLRSREPDQEARAATTTPVPSPEGPGLVPDEQAPDDLWRRAEALARQGNFREGVRYLYLAVLTQLHRADLIRYEKTRTNGEYLRQLGAADAGAPVVGPFRRLTQLFEQKWYGERSCAADDYDGCRALASEVRAGAGL
jgi:hypothetical protein